MCYFNYFICYSNYVRCEGNFWMWILSVLLVVLIIVIVLLNFKRSKLQKEVESLIPMLEVVENLKDIMYYCELKPSLKYRYLSPVVRPVFWQGCYAGTYKKP